MKQSEKSYKRIVVKIGSSLFYSSEGQLKILNLFNIVSGISFLKEIDQREIIIVSSGAIALGMDLLKLKIRPKRLPFLQAVAAIGQNALMDNYSAFFKKYRIKCAQILLTQDDFSSRQRYLNVKNTLLKLLELGIVPIINENDTVSTEEIKFGDNDKLSALVASLINADILIILSDVGGLLDREKKIIPVVDEITLEIKNLACPTDKEKCRGGMITKIEAAKIAMNSGIPCVISNGRTKEIILSVVRDPKKNGTLFVPKKSLSAREHWIAFGTKPKGKIIVDQGAKSALCNKKSLLSVGVIGIENTFAERDIVSIVDQEGEEFARGKSGVSSKQLVQVEGRRFEKEVIHRDNIVIL